MSKKMLIDATHAEETRVVILSGGRLEELDVDTSTKKQIKGNIYLAKIVRVEPSLQAAFVEYGGNRHGFLAFGEIHPDYYQIPTADREALKKEMMKQSGGSEDDGDKDDRHQKDEDVEVVSESETEDVVYKRPSFLKRYRIQEVIHQGQIMLVQVVKEERGNKGAALTTYLSLAGRFSVLMPNNGKGGGVSRKITNAKDRKSLRDIVDKLPIPDGMSVIVRTAGQGKTKSDIKRDYDYLIKTWMKIRENTLESIAPKLIHQEGDIIKRSLRDVFTPDIDEILVEGEETFKDAKAFMKLILPTYVKRVKQYKDKTPLFLEYQVESQLEAIHSNVVQLRSGGYIVIDQTEALVSVDVNSGRATREHNIEETALRTNLETCEELARQLKLRDLAGLIVIDFIDMDEGKNNAAVERALKEALKKDRARIQVGRISGFGLLEMSRQRLHSSFLEGSYNACPCCSGKGLVRSIESCAMHALHLLEEAALKNPEGTLVLSVPLGVASYVLNNKRLSLVDLETKYGVAIQIAADATLPKQSDYKLERLRVNGERVLIQHAANEASIRKENDRGRNNGGHNKKNKQQSSKQGASENKETEKRETQKRPPEKKEEKTVHKKDVADKTESVANGGGEADPAQSEARKRRREEWKRRREEERFFRKEQKRLEAEKAKAALSAPETAGEENFKVVAQEDIGSFEKKAEKKEKDVSNETPVVEEKSNEPSKKGWWNRLVK